MMLLPSGQIASDAGTTMAGTDTAAGEAVQGPPLHHHMVDEATAAAATLHAALHHQQHLQAASLGSSGGGVANGLEKAASRLGQRRDGFRQEGDGGGGGGGGAGSGAQLPGRHGGSNGDAPIHQGTQGVFHASGAALHSLLTAVQATQRIADSGGCSSGSGGGAGTQ